MPPFFKSRELKIIFLLCCLAAIRVFIFSAAFPYFNNVDEREHFDLIVKYSHGEIPRGAETMSPESDDYFSRYDCAAYFQNPPAIKNQSFPPEENYEASQPPLYYVLAGFYWKITRALGLEGGGRLYGLRFLNVFFVIALVWLGYLMSRKIFPDNYFLRLGVPALLAFMPQSAFYSIGNDILSPLCFGVVFICLVKLLRDEIPSTRLSFVAGLALAATFLTKMTNLPLIIVAFTVIVLKIRRLAAEKKLKSSLPSLAILICCATLPMAAWTVVCKKHFGDFTGSKLKMEHFGWTYKTFGEWWRHPIFTPHGLWTYLSLQLATFWQGEFFWHGKPMTLPPLNYIYTIASLILLALALGGLFKHRATINPTYRDALSLSFICFGAALGFFAFLSIIYDFGDCINPSREVPYFHAGRMILGALIPFMLLFVYGIDRALKKFGDTAKFLVLAAIILFMLISEIVTDWPVFSSQYNWFHM